MTWIDFLSYDNLSFISSLLFGLTIITWLFNVYSFPEKPQVVYRKLKGDATSVAEEVARRCPILSEKYIPPVLWGRSGHIQAHVYGAVGRVSAPQLVGHRQRRVATDGATITFDVFYPAALSISHPGDHPIIVLIPGFGNGSDRPYVWVLVNELNRVGYVVVVLNHLGAIANEKLTSRRIFTYGGTDDFQLMVDWVLETWPGKRLIGLGLSMGGNILMKFLGEKPERQAHFIGAASACQGYNIVKAMPTWKTWEGLRRVYAYHVTRNYLNVVRRHSDVLFSPPTNEAEDSVDGEGMPVTVPDMKRTLSATSIMEVDIHLQRHILQFNTLEEYYEQQSCCHHLHKITNIPVLLLNALDDPLVPETLLECAREYATTSPNAMFVLTKHGSHLGFFEGGILIPNTVTWLDRMLMQFAQAVEEYIAK